MELTIKTIDEAPPQALDIERAVIGAMLIERDAVTSAIETDVSDSFYHPQHSLIFRAIKELYLADHPVDQLSVIEKLRGAKNINIDEIELSLPEMASEAANVATVKYYCQQLKDKATLRKLLALAASIKSRCYEQNASPANILTDIDTGIVGMLNSTDGFKSVKRAGEVIPEVMDIIERRALSQTGIVGIPTGFEKLNEITSGWHRGNYIIVGAPTKSGKTNLGLHFAITAVEREIPVIVFSMEMTHRELVERLVSNKSDFETTAAHYHKPTTQDWESMARASSRIDTWPFYIDSTAGISIAQLSARIKSLLKKYKAGLVVVDYLQLMSGMGERNRQAEVEHISRGLKALALSVDIPIIVISQYNRGVKGETRRPVLQDLRDSGALEQDANIVILLHQPTEDEINENMPGTYAKHEIRTLIVAANRQGPTGDIPVRFRGEISKFMDI